SASAASSATTAGHHARGDEVAVLVGQFAPFHRAHLQVLRAALSSYRLNVVVLGSAFQAPSPKNPFTWQQRADMIGLCLTEEEKLRVRFLPARDHHLDERWGEEVSRGVLELAGGVSHRQITVVNPEPRMGTGANSFDWPKIFPRWGHAPLPAQSRDEAALDTAAIRKVLFSVEHEAKEAALAYLKETVPDEVRRYLSAWWESPLRARLADEAEWVRQYRKKWPAEQAMTTDAVVTCSNHVLLIERGDGAGAGLFALPGGFLEKDERFYDSARRELREETGLGYIGDGLDIAFVRAEVFDRADRSLRARIVTVAHLFELKVTSLPDVQGRDDARHALWVPIAELPALEERFFEDHFQIVDYFLGLTRPTDSGPGKR
ncbi:MAG: NUDIX domain-containing protein, partial [Lautropia sp.]|nr:NUDIX domain-containing protein [Lautropia sp.]